MSQAPVDWDSLGKLFEDPAQVNGPEIQGQIVGLDAALRDFLRTYEMPDNFPGIKDCVLALPLPNWQEWGWVEQGDTASQGAGSTTPVTVFTVPDNERAMLHSFELVRASGDNTTRSLSYTQGADYGTGSREQLLVYPAVAAVGVWWPIMADLAISRAGAPGPVLLEPGAIVAFLPEGAGVGATIWTYSLSLTRTKIVRVLTP